jgi:GxxExxY protein
MNKDELNRIGGIILDSSIYVHRALGPGLLESVYQKGLKIVLKRRGLEVKSEVPIRFEFEGTDLGEAFIIDLLVNDSVLIELKSVQQLMPVHEAQLLTYLKLSKKHLGYLINFNVPILKQGFKRYVRNW